MATNQELVQPHKVDFYSGRGGCAVLRFCAQCSLQWVDCFRKNKLWVLPARRPNLYGAFTRVIYFLSWLTRARPPRYKWTFMREFRGIIAGRAPSPTQRSRETWRP